MHGCVTRCKEIQQHAEADAEELSDNSHLAYYDLWRLRGNIIRTALCWIVWHNA